MDGDKNPNLIMLLLFGSLVFTTTNFDSLDINNISFQMTEKHFYFVIDRDI